MAITQVKAGGIAADSIDETKIADNGIDSEHYNDASIDHEHLADDAVDADILADNSVGLAAMAHGTDGNLITFNASGEPAYVTTGNDGQVLTSAGAGAAPVFEDAAAGGKILQVQTVQSTTSLSATDSSFTHWNQLDRTFTPTASDSTLFIVTALGHVKAKGSDDPITYVALTSNDNSSRLWEGTVASQASGGSVSNTELDASYTNVWTEGAGSTSERTYKIYYKLGRGSQLMINGNSGTSSSLTVIEVAA